VVSRPEARFCGRCGVELVDASGQEQTPAQEIFRRASTSKDFIAGIFKDDLQAYRRAIGEFERALALGLPPGDEVEAHLSVAEGYIALARKRMRDDEDFEGFTKASEFTKALAELERSLELDRVVALHVFEEPLNRARLAQFDNAYFLVARSLEETHGLDPSISYHPAISYLKSKVKLFDYLSSTPVLSSYLELGNLFYRYNMAKPAISCFDRIIAAQPVLQEESENEERIRDSARQNIEAAKELRAKHTCFIATAVYGDSSREEVEVLRSFRERELKRFAIGRRMIRLYERLSPPIAYKLSQHPRLSDVVRCFLLQPIVGILRLYSRTDH